MTATLAVLAPDAALPLRDVLLDDDAVSQRLGLRCSRIRAKYRIGESLRVTFRTGPGPGDVVSARMFPPGRSGQQAERARAAAARDGATPDAVRHDPDLGTVFWRFPQDRRLTGLGVLTDPPEPLRDAFGRPWAGSTLMAYSPEKAATARWLDVSGQVLGYAKVQVAPLGAHGVAVLRTVADRLGRHPGGPDLADVVAHHPELGLALTSPAPGRSLHDLPRAQVPAALARLGAALARLHGTAADGLPAFTRLDPTRLVRAAELLTAARPDVAPLAAAVVCALLADRPATAPAALLHGDLHPKNVLVHPGGISLVDLDQAAAGPAAAELGGLLARLWCPRPNDTIDAATADAAAHALLHGYGRTSRTEDLLWYAAAALVVERAVRAVSRVDESGLAALPDVLTTALRWAGRRPEVPR